MVDHFTRLDQTLAVGRCPARGERPWLRDQGLTGVLTLQSDADLELREIDWPAWIQDYAGMGIVADRVAVTDFDRPDLLDKLDEAVAALHRLIEDGRTVYVHCNAGVNRSPSVVIAYLVVHRGLTLETASAEVVEVHRPCFPYPEVMEAWGLRRESRS